jgi:hypothetical protein
MARDNTRLNLKGAVPEHSLVNNIPEAMKKQLLGTNNGKAFERLDYSPNYTQADPPRAFKA